MRFYGCSLRGLLPILLILVTTAYTAAQDAQKGLNQNNIATLIQLAKSGDADAQRQLGMMYFTGTDVAKNDVEAVRWFREAAEQGNAFAQYYVGLAYHEGNGAAKNASEAAAWFHKSAEQDYAQAQFSLGLMYADGDGVPKNLVDANFWAALGASVTVGDGKAKELYDALAAKLTPAMRIEVMERYKKWVRAHPQHSMAGLAHFAISAGSGTDDGILPETKKQMREMLALQAVSGFQKLNNQIRVEISGDNHDVLVFQHPSMKDGLADTMMTSLRSGDANFWNGLRLMDYKAIVFSGAGYRRTVNRHEFLGYCKNYEAYKTEFLKVLRNLQDGVQAERP